MDIGPNLTSIILQLITLLGVIVTAVGAYMTHRAVKEVRTSTDGMKDALVSATKAQATEVGKAEGVEVERVRAEGLAATK